MTSTTETNHAINVANFEDLISVCTGYGAEYNPSKSALKITSLTAQLTTAQAALKNLSNAKTIYENAIHAREIAMKPLKPLATRIINELTTTSALKLTIDDVRTINNKIQGRKGTPIKQPEVALPGGAAPVAVAERQVKTVSISQPSIDKLIDHFTLLVSLLMSEPTYNPHESELKVDTLNTILTDMKAKNNAVINNLTAITNARMMRDRLLYGEMTGITDTAIAVKQYVKSVFNASSPQFKQVSTLKFTRALLI